MVVKRARALSPVAYLQNRAVYKGLLGGNKGWMIVGGVIIGGRVLRRAVGRTEEVAALEVLRPGDQVVIRTIPAPTRAERKAARRAR